MILFEIVANFEMTEKLAKSCYMEKSYLNYL